MILQSFKEYILKLYGINARYKLPDSSKDDYQEQNIVVIYPSEISYTTNSNSGIIGVELRGQLALYITEGRKKEDFLFEKMFINQEDKKFSCTSNFTVNHWNEEVLEISCSFTYLEQYEFNKIERKLKEVSFEIINKD